MLFRSRARDAPRGWLDVAISANPEERRGLADLDKIPAIGRLDADFHVVRRGGTRLNVSGEMRARVTQICVVSLEPFEADVVEPIDVDFAPAEEVARAQAAASGLAGHGPEGAETEEPPDPIIDGKIDLGALAGEFLVLGLDPYPRKPGVTFDPAGQAGSLEERLSPFDVLAKIQNLKKNS